MTGSATTSERRAARVLALLLVVLTWAGGCTAQTEAEGGDSLATDSAAADSGSDVTTGRCPSGRGPTMVLVGDHFCIDSTEVSNAQYAAFLTDKGGDLSGQPAECGWNDSWLPHPDFWPKNGELPVVTVDWCDARAFCAWAGKRLCGAVGGGPVATADQANPGVDEWYQSCTGGGVLTYPYGNTYAPQACAGADSGGDKRAVGSQPGCEGGFPGLYDMSGNVWDFEDSCEGTGGPDDLCYARGGAYSHGAGPLRCASSYAFARSGGSADAGFRCCAD